MYLIKFRTRIRGISFSEDEHRNLREQFDCTSNHLVEWQPVRIGSCIVLIIQLEGRYFTHIFYKNTTYLNKYFFIQLSDYLPSSCKYTVHCYLKIQHTAYSQNNIRRKNKFLTMTLQRALYRLHKTFAEITSAGSGASSVQRYNLLPVYKQCICIVCAQRCLCACGG